MKRYFWKHKISLIATLFFTLLISGMLAYNSIILQQVVDQVAQRNMPGFIFYGAFLIVFFGLLGLVLFITNWLEAVYINKTMQGLSDDVFSGVVNQNYEGFYERDSGEYLSNLTNDINLVENQYFSTCLNLIGNVAKFVFTLIVLVSISPAATLALLALGSLLLIVPYIFGGRLEKKQAVVSNQFTVFTNKIKDLLQGYPVIQTFGLKLKAMEEFGEKNNALRKSKQDSGRMQALVMGVSTSLGAMTQAASLGIGGYFVFYGNLTVGSLIAIMNLSGGVVNPIQTIIQNYTQIKGIREINTKLLRLAGNRNSAAPAQTLPEFKQGLTLKELAFSYDAASPIIHPLNYTFEKNRKYAIMGKSGSGKSTLLRLLLGFHSSYEGDILLDGVSLKQMSPTDIGTRISVVPQEVYLFSNELGWNITFDKECEPERLDMILRQSGVDEIVKAFPDGLRLQLQDNGHNFSGGQKQRVGIARALYQDAPILLLDECTASLDSETSLAIERKLLALESVTAIHVTHKLHKQTLPMYDAILVLDQGRLVESGSFDDLMMQKGLLYDWFIHSEGEEDGEPIAV